MAEKQTEIHVPSNISAIFITSDCMIKLNAITNEALFIQTYNHHSGV
jgi:hypothetical protein